VSHLIYWTKEPAPVELLKLVSFLDNHPPLGSRIIGCLKDAKIITFDLPPKDPKDEEEYYYFPVKYYFDFEKFKTAISSYSLIRNRSFGKKCQALLMQYLGIKEPVQPVCECCGRPLITRRAWKKQLENLAG